MITEYLQKILSARYGKDVRQAIHDGIQQCYYDGKAGAIDMEARQAIEKLNEDLEELSESGITTTTSTTQPNSYAGREHILEIGGVMEQDSTSGKNIFGFGKNTTDVTEELRPNTSQRLNISSVDSNPNKIKCNYTGGGYSTGYIAIYGVDGTKDWVVSFNVESNTTEYTPIMKKDKTNSSAERLVIQVGGGNNGTYVAKDQYFVLSNIQVEAGTANTA